MTADDPAGGEPAEHDAPTAHTAAGADPGVRVEDRPALRSPAGQHPATEGEAVLTRRGARVERATAASFGVSMVAALGLAVVYWQGGQVQLEGILLAVALGGIGVGIVLWAKHFMPHEEVAEDRHPLESSAEQIALFTEAFEAGESSLRRRRVLVAMGGGACAALGVALLFPVRSLGPRPGSGLKRTPYAGGGKRLVTEDGEPVRPDDLEPGGFTTVWPEGHTDAPDAPTLLIRVAEGQTIEARDGRDGWTIGSADGGGVIAYSKLCTHVGCPVGLYQTESALLLCPCHQSTFDVLDGARPVFGPAARSLPQLPLEVDGDGYIVASGDFSDPVGPGFWDRDRGR